MASVDFPTTLPEPRQVTSSPKYRARTSGLPGTQGYTAPERDYYGALSVEFFLTKAQAAIFKAWWDSNKGYWFNAVWPRLSQSLSVYRILGAPTFTHVIDGAYRISVKMELRGASLAVGITPPISDVWAVKQGAVGTTLALPAHEANDVIVLFAKGAGSVPSLPAAWTNIASVSSSYAIHSRAFYIKDVANTVTTVSSANANTLYAVCYRGVGLIGVAGVTAEVVGPPASGNLPTLSLVSPGTSRVYGVVNTNQGNNLIVTPTGMQLRLDNRVPSVGGGDIAIFDTPDAVSVFNGPLVSWVHNSVSYAIAFELIPA